MSLLPLGGDSPPQVFGALKFDLAPEDPGIYAWYARFGLSEDDWEPRVCDGVDLASRDIVRAVSDYARVHQPSPVGFTGTGDYDLSWDGRIRRQSICDVKSGDSESIVARYLTSVRDEPKQRRRLIQLLGNSVPILAVHYISALLGTFVKDCRNISMITKVRSR